MLDIFKKILNKKKKLTISDKDKIAGIVGNKCRSIGSF